MIRTKMPIPGAMLAAAALLILLSARSAPASDPSLARYTDDPSRIFWFIQISDLHVHNILAAGAEEKLTWVLTTATGIVDPFFIVATGDLTDSTLATLPYYGFGPIPEEWDLYRSIVDGAGMTADFYYDVIGNHDAYGDDGASYYLSRSVQGSTQNTTQPDWRLDLPFGSYHFVAVATTCNDWAQWPFDRMEITDAEYNELNDNLSANTDSRLTIGAAHHDYIRAKNGTDVINGARVEELFTTYRVPYFIHGHEHDLQTRLSDGGVIIQRIDSLGQSDGYNFCVHAVDSDAISFACSSANSAWPLAVITAPVDARLSGDNSVNNPYAPTVPTTCAEAPLRALVFDAVPVVSVTFWWDSGAAGGLTASTTIPSQWTGTFDSTALSPGVHTLGLEVIGSETRDFEIQVVFEDRTCDLTPDTPDEDMEETAEAVEEPSAEETVQQEEVAEVTQDPEAQPDARPDTAPDTAVDAIDGDAAADDVDETEGEVAESGCGCRTVS